jgi:hypothetical protein
MIGKDPNYLSQYNPYIKKYIRTSKDKIEPMNVYKIQTYRYVDGVVRSKTALDVSLVFVVGIHLKELYCVRLNGIKPTDFLGWGRKILNKDILPTINEETTPLKPIMNEFSRGGKDLFLTHIKSSSVMYGGRNSSAFRTYKSEGVIYAQQALFNTDKLKQFYV